MNLDCSDFFSLLCTTENPVDLIHKIPKHKKAYFSPTKLHADYTRPAAIVYKTSFYQQNDKKRDTFCARVFLFNSY